MNTGLLATSDAVLMSRGAAENRTGLIGRNVALRYSSAAGGLTIEANIRHVEASPWGEESGLEPDLDLLSRELHAAVRFVGSDAFRADPRYARLPDSLRVLRHVALVGDQEPTGAPHFSEIVATVALVRALNRKFFKIVLETDGSELHQDEVQAGLKLLTSLDEIWVKFGMRGGVVERVFVNLLGLARKRPIILQSTLPEQEAEAALREFIGQLEELKSKGAKIQIVQISAVGARPEMAGGAPSLRKLKEAAKAVREATGINAQVF